MSNDKTGKSNEVAGQSNGYQLASPPRLSKPSKTPPASTSGYDVKAFADATGRSAKGLRPAK